MHIDETAGILFLLLLALDIWAIVNILHSNAASRAKLTWTAAVALLPLLGLIVWYYRGPRIGKA
jgi:hypothetical protein